MGWALDLGMHYREDRLGQKSAVETLASDLQEADLGFPTLLLTIRQPQGDPLEMS